MEHPSYTAELEKKCAGVEAERDAWIETAAQHCRNEEYYRGLVVQIGQLFGAAAMTSDDGSVQDHVLCAKVPELVAALKATVAQEREACAELAERMGRPGEPVRAETARQIATAIRAQP